MPFSLGPKSCAGQHLALLETKTALAMMIACFNFKLAPCMGGLKGVKDKTILAITLKVKGGMWLTASKRAMSVTE